jgi:hypothetical protein
MDHMSASRAPHTPVAAPPIKVPLWAWLIVAVAIFAAYLMTMENGVLLGHSAETLHELFHDARHFTGVPCH